MHPSPVAPFGLHDGQDLAAKALVEYVWVAGSGSQLRSKTRVLDARPNCVEDVPVLLVEGGSYGAGDGMALDNEGDVFLKPRKLFNDPFRRGGQLCLCDSFKIAPSSAPAGSATPAPVLTPHASNHRAVCAQVQASSGADVPAFSFQQEYSIKATSLSPPPSLPTAPMRAAAPMQFVHPYVMNPFQAPPVDAPVPSKPMGAAARRLAEHHLMACLRAGITVAEISQQASCTPKSSSTTSDQSAATGLGGSPPAPPVWSYKLSPQPGVEAGDQLWMSRFLLQRVSEDEGLQVTYKHGAGGGGMRCQVSVSTAASRTPGSGIGVVQEHMMLLHAAKLQHGPPPYCEPSAPASLAHGLKVAIGRGAGAATDVDAVIPSTTLIQQCGEWTDCRPAAGADPYVVVGTLMHHLQPDAGLHRAMQTDLHHHHHHQEGAFAAQQHLPPHTCVGSPGSSEPALTHGKPSPVSSATLDFLCERSLGSCASDFSDGDEADSRNIDDDSCSINSEDLLIAELDRMDRRHKAPKRSRSSVSIMSPVMSCEPGVDGRSRQRKCLQPLPDHLGTAHKSASCNVAWACEGSGESR